MATTMTRIWNITDDPNTDVPAQPVVVLGKTIMPGRFAAVDSSLLTNAHKLKEDIANKLVFVGKNPPVTYVQTKSPAKATLDPKVNRSHGALAAVAVTPVAAPVADTTPEADPAPTSDPDPLAPKAQKPKKSWSNGQ